jgi:hypothetical protein
MRAFGRKCDGLPSFRTVAGPPSFMAAWQLATGEFSRIAAKSGLWPQVGLPVGRFSGLSLFGLHGYHGRILLNLRFEI